MEERERVCERERERERERVRVRSRNRQTDKKTGRMIDKDRQRKMKRLL